MPFRVDKTGRRRYIGQARRGNPGTITRALGDLEQATTALQTARTFLASAQGEQSRVRKLAELAEARSYARIAAGFIRDAFASVPKPKPAKPAKQMPLPFKRR